MTSDIILHSELLYYRRLPISSLLIVVLTPIGPLIITVNLDFYYSFSINVGITNFRDVYIDVLFTTGLNLRVFAGFHFVIIKAGVYIDGDIINITPTAGFKAINFIPVTLIEQLAPLEEFKR